MNWRHMYWVLWLLRSERVGYWQKESVPVLVFGYWKRCLLLCSNVADRFRTVSLYEVVRRMIDSDEKRKTRIWCPLTLAFPRIVSILILCLYNSYFPSRWDPRRFHINHWSSILRKLWKIYRIFEPNSLWHSRVCTRIRLSNEYAQFGGSSPSIPGAAGRKYLEVAVRYYFQRRHCTWTTFWV